VREAGGLQGARVDGRPLSVPTAYRGPVRGPLTPDDVEGLYARARTPQQHRAAAAQLGEWAGEVHPDDDDVTPASLLVSAGEHLTTAGDHEAAVALLRRAVAAAGHVPPDVRCYLHSGLLTVGDLDGARRLAEELRHDRSADSDVFLFVGENYELVDDLREAHRWMTMGLLRTVGQVEQGNDLAAGDAATLAGARYRVRRALDLPVDEYDELVEMARSDD
jgi:hypothetical protein